MNTDKYGMCKRWIYRLQHIQTFLLIILVAGFPYDEMSIVLTYSGQHVQTWMWTLLVLATTLMLRDIQETIKALIRNPKVKVIENGKT